jgi:hypothetical protein
MCCIAASGTPEAIAESKRSILTKRKWGIVTHETNGKNIRPDKYSIIAIIAGLMISATDGTGDSSKVTAHEGSPLSGIVLRHNKFIGGATYSQIILVGNVTTPLSLAMTSSMRVANR